MSIFSVPQNGDTYTQLVFSRCNQLIESRIWEGIDRLRFRIWLNNFKSDEERYFAACVLDNLIYRSESQTVSLMKQMIQRVLPDLARETGREELKIIDFENSLRTFNSPEKAGFCFIPLSFSYGAIGKSGDVISRMYRLKLQINDLMIRPAKDIGGLRLNGVRCFIFIDDFLGTGQQFSTFMNEEMLRSQLQDCFCAYLPLVAHQRGIEELEKEWPSLRVRAVEYLNESHGAFSEKSGCFDDGVNTVDCAQTFYYDLLIRKKIEVDRENRRGYGHLGLMYAFQHAAPDNCLPILWWGESSDWKPLFDR